MATCKGCVHYKLCGVFGYVFPVESCGFYTDRSRFVELPCKIGDTVYLITERTEKFGRKKVKDNIIVECSVDNFKIGDLGYPLAELCNSDNKWWCGIEPKDFGRTVFLTREEAEHALKERGTK